MKLNIYTRENCSHCAAVQIPEEIDVNIIDIEKDYSGFIPEQVPILQVQGMNFQGPVVINGILKIIKEAQDDNYKG